MSQVYNGGKKVEGCVQQELMGLGNVDNVG